MGKNYFSQEEVKELEKNLYVKKVSEKAITYSQEFKEEFWLLLQEDMIPVEIFRKMGFDTKVIGRQRISNTAHRIRQQAKREKGFADTRLENVGRPKTRDMTIEEHNNYLKHENKVLKQQVYALKKMKQLERETLWKHSRHQKKNSN